MKNDRWGKGQRWLARWTVAGRERSRAFATKEAAQEHLVRVSLGGDTVPGPIMADLVESWRTAQLHHRESTVDSTRRTVQRIVDALGPIRITDLTRAHVQMAVTGWSETLAPSTVHVTFSSLTSTCKMAVLDGLIPVSPCVGVRLPRKRKARIVPLTVEQVAEIATRIPSSYRTAVAFTAATGLRQGELRGLTWDRVDGRTLTVDRQLVSVDRHGAPVWGPVKTESSDRVLDMGLVAREVLDEQLELSGGNRHGLVWLSRHRGPVGRTTFSDAWRNAVEGMGLPPRSGWHSLRHFHASLLIADGLSPRLVADRLGHRNASETLDTYSHLWPSDESRAVASVDAALAGFVADSWSVSGPSSVPERNPAWL